jgi:hypothetical protein
MESVATQQLRALQWTSITTQLQTLAASWTRLRVDHLPTPGKTLRSLQEHYRELLEAMPLSSAQEVEAALCQFTRGLRLKGDVVTATQRKYILEYCAPHRFGQLGEAPVPTISYDGSYPYLEPLLDTPDSPATVISMGVLYYVGDHRSLGALYPTFTDELRGRFQEAPVRAGLVDPNGRVTLDRVRTTHSRYIAELIGRSKAEPIRLAAADRPDYGELADDPAVGTWLDDLLADEPEDDESTWSVLATPRRQHRPGWAEPHYQQ